MVTNRDLFLRHVGQTSSAPLLLDIESAEGVFLYTRDKKRYVDMVSGVSVSNLGHRHPAIVEAVKNQASDYMHLMVYGEYIQSPQVQYADWLTDHLPKGLDQVFFVNSGSEAIEGAMKLAKRVTGRHTIAAFRNAYHGGTQGALSILGDPTYHSGFLPLLPGIRHIRYNREEDLERIDRDTAAVFVEPIQAEAGIIEPENGFLKKLKKRCEETGALFVLDEIQTGFGRTGSLFAFEHYDVVPDIVCFAKSFGGGMPLGAFVAPAELMKQLTFDPPLGHITTFGGHPVSCAAGLAAQRYMEEHHLIEHAEAMGKIYRRLMKHPVIDHMRGRGLYQAVVFRPGFPIGDFIRHALDCGVVLDQFLFCHNAFRISPPLIIDESTVAYSAELLLEAIDRTVA